MPAWPLIAILLPVAMELRAGLGATDLAYLLRFGSDILHSGKIPMHDYASFLAAGNTWIDQQWGVQVIIAWLFSWGGWFVLAVLYAALIAATAYFLYRACTATGASSRVAAVLTLLAMLAAYASLSLRAQLFAAALFALTLWILAVRGSHPRRLWLLPLVAVLWSNFHGSFFLLPLLCGLAWIEEISVGSRLHWRLLAVTALAGLGTLLNPFGWEVWRYLFTQVTSPTIAGITSEWQPPTLHDAYGILFFVSVAAMAVVLWWRRAVTSWTQLLTLAVFLAMALLAERNGLWWSMVAAVVVARTLARAPISYRLRPNPGMDLVAAVAVAVFVLTSFPWGLAGKPADAPGPYLDNAPQGVSQALAHTLRPGERIFNDQPWGSWLEFASPNNPVAADSIIEATSKQNWDLYFRVAAAKPGWQDVLSNWNVKALVLSRQNQAQLIKALRAEPGWRMTYADGKAAIYRRDR